MATTTPHTAQNPEGPSRRHPRRHGAAWVTLAALLLTACPPTPPTGDGGVVDDFDDHTAEVLATLDDFDAFARAQVTREVVKFIISDFTIPVLRKNRWLESREFYTLHDEWYWFRLLNGAEAPGSTTAPYPGAFDDIPAVYAWARQQPVLPLDLRWAGDDRLYSPEFYAKTLNDVPRAYGAGTLYHFPRRENEFGFVPETWAFELEFSDDVTADEVRIYFETLLPTVPPEVGPELKWLIRSPAQEATAQQMQDEGLPYADRVLRYRDITLPGELEVYAPGLTAGRLRVVRSGEQGLEDSTKNDILVVEDLPDYLPPCSALISAKPQTPLAHINVLARNRGIPNLYVAGILDDPEFDALARVRAPVVLKAWLGDDDTHAGYDLKAISEADFATWRSLTAPPEVAVPAVDLSNAPLTVDLLTADAADVDELRPLIGGKAAGFLGLIAPEHAGLDALDIPHAPIAITARVFSEHRQQYLSSVEAMENDFEFRRSARARYLVLEGEEAYRARYRAPSDENYLASFMGDRPEGHLVGDLVRNGGLVHVVQSTPIDVDMLTAIDDELHERFTTYAIEQGLRFRSSSTVEDIEGFNGAGLYTSNTGFLFNEEMDREKDRLRSVEHALLMTFSSYWGSEAYEERELSNVVHASGNMAVLVHARFDDDKEVSNGVFTFTVMPPEVVARGGDAFVLEVNVQKGALSVTNPPPGSTALPEVFEVRQAEGEAPRLERLSPSTEMPEGQWLFSEAKAIELFDDAKNVTELWLERDNDPLLGAQASRTLTLDFELREMDHGWPALNNGGSFGRRVIIKQARSLEPGLLRVPDDVVAQPIPRDVLARASRVLRRRCESGLVEVSVVEVTTDALQLPDLGYTDVPFLGFITVYVKQDLPELGLNAGRRFSISHTGIDEVVFDGDVETDYDATIHIGSPFDMVYGIEQVRITDDALVLSGATDDVTSTVVGGCSRTVQYATADVFLEGLLDD